LHTVHYFTVTNPHTAWAALLLFADCAPGLAMDASNNCQPCTLGKYCLGGDLTVNPNNTAKDCPDGLATTFAGAKSQAQCFTKPGYGRKSQTGSNGKVILSGELCPVGSYNVGSNTAGCQKCGAGLTTANNGSDAAADCSECHGWLPAYVGCISCNFNAHSQQQKQQPAATTVLGVQQPCCLVWLYLQQQQQLVTYAGSACSM
jgi:hypothetical protein